VQVRQGFNLRHKKDRYTEEKEIGKYLGTSKGEDRSVFPFCVSRGFREGHGKEDKGGAFKACKS
jgi:hypothetical protein